MALALYRKYRPQSFGEVRGQEHVTEPLIQALRNNRLNHAYLFSGPRGCGKTTSARILARSVNCVQGPTPDPCGACDSCVALGPGGSGSVDVIEIDAASHGGVDDARELRERAVFAPVQSKFKVYVIDEAHMVSSAGFNALLKLVEEPPSYVMFVFATTEPDKVLPTIKSRTHHYPFRLIPPATLRAYLEELAEREGVTVEPAVYPLVVRAGGGSARDTLSVLDQLIAGAGPEGVTYQRAIGLLGVTDVSLIDEMCDAFAAADGAGAMQVIDRVVEAGHDPRRFAADLLERLRDLIVLNQVPDAAGNGLIDVPADQLERMTGQALRLGAASLTRMAEIVHEGLLAMRGTTAARLILELVCAKALLPNVDDAAAGLLQRLDQLERRVADGIVGTGGASGGGGGGLGAGGLGAGGAGGPGGGRTDDAAPPLPPGMTPAQAAKEAAARAAASAKGNAGGRGGVSPAGGQTPPSQGAEPISSAPNPAPSAQIGTNDPVDNSPVVDNSSRREDTDAGAGAAARAASAAPDRTATPPATPQNDPHDTATPSGHPPAGGDGPRAPGRPDSAEPVDEQTPPSQGAEPISSGPNRTAPAQIRPNEPVDNSPVVDNSGPSGVGGPGGGNPGQNPAHRPAGSTPAQTAPHNPAQPPVHNPTQPPDRAPSDPPPAASAHPDAAAVRRSWDAIRDLVKRRKRTVGAYLMEATVRDVEHDTIVLAFRHAFHAGAMSKPEAIDIFAGALGEVMGGTWKVRCEVGDGPPPAAQRTAAQHNSARPQAPAQTAKPAQRPEAPRAPERAPQRPAGPDGGSPPTNRPPGQRSAPQAPGRPPGAHDDVPWPDEPPPEDRDEPPPAGYARVEFDDTEAIPIGTAQERAERLLTSEFGAENIG